MKALMHRGVRPAWLLLGLLILLAACQQNSSVVEESNEDEGETAVLPTVAPTAVVEMPVTRVITATIAIPTLTPIPTSVPEATPIPFPEVEAALVAVSMDSRVGVLLDEFPPELREAVIDYLREQPDDFWIERAKRQVRLTERRLDFRNYIYASLGQLPLPPQPLWEIELLSEPRREELEGNDLFLLDYRFTGTLLSDAASVAESEPALAEIGGVRTEPFVFPIDPELILQRTGIACLNEAGFPPNSYDSENAFVFYDHTCTAASGGPAGCHRNILPQLDCFTAVQFNVGAVATEVRFERVGWDDDLADSVRIGDLTVLGAPDLNVVNSDLEKNRIVYRYFTPESCAFLEGGVGGTGWRRLLMFTATVHNTGTEPLHIGLVNRENPLRNLFTYDQCHDHFHYSNYGEFDFSNFSQPSKIAFCVESTTRSSNNEATPITHPYSCTFQGIQAGWVDEYDAGLDSQWIDITELPFEAETADFTLAFRSNVDRFLCEGTAVLDDEGNPLWEPSGFVAENGQEYDRPVCDFIEDWDANNEGELPMTVSATGSFVTEPCASGELGPLRNCGFTEMPLPDDEPFSCEPGETVALTCSVAGDALPQAVRVCEWSAALGTGTACMLVQSLWNGTVGAETAVNFTCPLPRDENEPGGAFVFYAGALVGDETATVSCSAR